MQIGLLTVRSPGAKFQMLCPHGIRFSFVQKTKWHVTVSIRNSVFLRECTHSFTDCASTLATRHVASIFLRYSVKTESAAAADSVLSIEILCPLNRVRSFCRVSEPNSSR